MVTTVQKTDREIYRLSPFKINSIPILINVVFQVYEGCSFFYSERAFVKVFFFRIDPPPQHKPLPYCFVFRVWLRKSLSQDIPNLLISNNVHSLSSKQFPLNTLTFPQNFNPPKCLALNLQKKISKCEWTRMKMKSNQNMDWEKTYCQISQ